MSIIRQAYKLLRRAQRSSRTYDHEWLCRFFTDAVVIRHGEDTVVLPRDASRVFLRIRICESDSDSDSDSDSSDSDSDSDGEVKNMNCYFCSLDHGAAVEISRISPITKDMDMCIYPDYIYGGESYISHLDCVLQSLGRIPTNIWVHSSSTVEDRILQVKQYIQSSWPKHIVHVDRIYENKYYELYRHTHRSVHEWIEKNQPSIQAREEVEDETEPDETRACPICITNKKKVILLPCGHGTCWGCSERLSQSGSTCPTCRSTICRRHRIFV